MSAKIDLKKFKNVLPYDSELFGVYQPLLGWKSKRIIKKFYLGIKDSQFKIIDSLISRMNPDTEVDITDYTSNKVHFGHPKLNMASLSLPNKTNIHQAYDYYITRLIEKRIEENGYKKTDEHIWEKLVSEEAFAELLPEVLKQIEENHSFIAARLRAEVPGGDLSYTANKELVSEILRERFNTESAMAGALNYLHLNKKHDTLVKMFFSEEKVVDFSQLDEISQFLDPMENFDPKTEIGRVSLSPIGIVHLFRQYFFEFDTFLGPPVRHIWLSPGSSLELIETHSRRQIIERSLESSVETTLRSEKSLTEQDELSDAVREENQSNSKFGMSINVGGTVSGGVPGVYSATGHLDTTTTYGLESNQKTAKEATHKQMRQQSEKLSSEIKKNFKTTFKTTTEMQDTSSKRYVLQNITNELVNYELRRKMRQVGVQVQDIGTSLCWQTYVDLPGHDLGLANLVHLAEPADLAALPHPELPVVPQPITKDYTAKLFFKAWWGDNDTVETYTEHGPLDDKGGANADFWNDYIHMNYLDYKVEQVPGYALSQVVYESCIEGKMVEPEFFNLSTFGFSIHLKKVNFDGDFLTLKLKLVYSAEDATIKAANDRYNTEMQTYNIEKAKQAKDAFVTSARDRIKVASKIESRNFEELREEERTIVYRYLIGDLLKVGVDMSNAQTRHIMAELINSMFDVDKMLYFTAPEWWMPRARMVTEQNVGGKPSHLFQSEDIISWGGAESNYRPNYYITEDSQPAKLGSSLGWLLQLDGDNIRNAFLNAPWVKAVIPIRQGKELAALNWLMKANVEGTSGITAKYQEGSEADLNKMILYLENYPFATEDPRKVRYANFSTKIRNDPVNFYLTIEDALISLSLEIKQKHEMSNKIVSENVDGETKKYLPTDKVFENGFDPLKDGFQAETKEQFVLCDQWVEVLPTDQVVAVEVKYDPKTGRQV